MASTEALYKAYAIAIKNQFLGGQELGKNDRLYINAMGELAIPVGVPEITSREIYKAGNSLLDPTSPIFQAGGATYFSRLQTYMGAVVLVKNPDRGYLKQLEDARERVKTTGAAFRKTRGEATKEWKEDPDNLSFDQWVTRYYAEYGVAQKAMNAAWHDYHQIQLRVGGANAGKHKTILERLESADDTLQPHNPYNMRVTIKDVVKSSELSDSDISYSPTFNIADYKATVENWINTFDYNVQHPSKKITFSLAEGKSQSWSDFGQSSGSFQFSSCPFIQIEGGASTSHDCLDLESSTEDLKGEITFVGANIFTLHTGDWDVSEPRADWPNLLPDVEQDFKARPMVKPQKFLIGYGVGINITFGETAYKRVKELHTRAASIGASFRIGCFTFGSASASTSSTRTLDQIKFSQGNSSISYAPKQDNRPLLLGVIGTIVS